MLATNNFIITYESDNSTIKNVKLELDATQSTEIDFVNGTDGQLLRIHNHDSVLNFNFDLILSREGARGLIDVLTKMTRRLSNTSPTPTPNYRGIEKLYNQVVLEIQSNSVTIGIPEYDENLHSLTVYKNSVFLSDNLYTVNDGNVILNSGTFESGDILDFVVERLI